MPVDAALDLIATELDLPRGYTEGLLRAVSLANRIVRTLGDATQCVSVEFYHAKPGRTVLSMKAPDGLCVYPPEQRAISREDRKRDK